MIFSGLSFLHFKIGEGKLEVLSSLVDVHSISICCEVLAQQETKLGMVVKIFPGGHLITRACLKHKLLGQVVRKLINADPRLKVNRGFHLAR